jgi:hypothetical protein
MTFLLFQSGCLSKKKPPNGGFFGVSAAYNKVGDSNLIQSYLLAKADY